jgi:hypothetical protein
MERLVMIDFRTVLRGWQGFGCNRQGNAQHRRSADIAECFSVHLPTGHDDGPQHVLRK